MSEKRAFSPVSEADVTRAILGGFVRELEEYVSCDAIVVGAGPSGLVCARELSRSGHRTLLVERNNYLGGGFWIGGFLMNKLTIRAPAHKELERLGVRVREATPGLYLADAPEAHRVLESRAVTGSMVLIP